MRVQEFLKSCQREHKAVLATNFYNFETLTAVLRAASAVGAPVMLQLTRSSIDYLGLKEAVGMARQGLPTTVWKGGCTSTTAIRPNWPRSASMPGSTR